MIVTTYNLVEIGPLLLVFVKHAPGSRTVHTTTQVATRTFSEPESLLANRRRASDSLELDFKKLHILGMFR